MGLHFEIFCLYSFGPRDQGALVLMVGNVFSRLPGGAFNN